MKKTFHIFILMAIISGCSQITHQTRLQPKEDDEIILRKVVAVQLNKGQNYEDITGDDFAKIEKLYLNDLTISDLQILNLFPNLKTLSYGYHPSMSRDPGDKLWFGPPGDTFDFNQIKDISTLETITLTNMKIKNFESITYLQNLKELSLPGSKIDNIEPVKQLKNLKAFFYLDITEEQIKELQQALPDLTIVR